MIKVLDEFSHIRKRPEMYIGSIDCPSKLLDELIDNAIDELQHMSDKKNLLLDLDIPAIHVTKYMIDNNNILFSVFDSGRGIPLDYIEYEVNGNKFTEKIPYLITTKLYSSGKFDVDEYKISSGLHGIGLTATNVLSKLFGFFIYRDNKFYILIMSSSNDSVDVIYETEFSVKRKTTFLKRLNKIIDELNRALSSKFNINDNVSNAIKYAVFNNIINNYDKYIKLQSFTNVFFIPDDAIFTTIDIPNKHIDNRLSSILLYDEYSDFILKYAEIDKESNVKINIYDGSTTNQFINNILQTSNDDVVYEIKCKNDIESFKVIFKLNAGSKRKTFSVVNSVITESGNHITFALNTINKILSKELPKQFKDVTDMYSNIKLSDYVNGSFIVLSNIIDRRFSSQSKNKLTTPTSYFSDRFEKCLEKQLIKIIKENQEAFRKYYNDLCVNEYKRIMTKNVLKEIKSSGKRKKQSIVLSQYHDCFKYDDSELFIVEGSSASGGILKMRNPENQAVFLLHGKIINASNNSITRILNNKDVKALLQVLDSGLYPEDDASKCKFKKVILTTDPDPDGAHITLLLLTIFSELLPSFIQSGKLYISDIPLYSVYDKRKKKYYPIYNKEDITKYVDNTRYVLYRYKGLAAIESNYLYELVLNRNTRRLLKVTVSDMNDINKIKYYMNKSVSSKTDLIEIFKTLGLVQIYE